MLSKLTKSVLIILTVALCCVCVGSAFALYRVDATPIVISISAEVPASPESIYIKGTWDNWTDLVPLTYSAGTYTYTHDFAASDRFKGYTTTWFTGNDYTFAKAGNYTLSYPESGTKLMTDFTVTANSYTYTIDISSSPSWAFGSGEVFMVWAWTDGVSAVWYEADSFDGTNKVLTVTLPPNLTMCDVVRLNPAYASDTIENRWNYKWNQTDDISLSSSSVSGTIH